jgi:hypothetical protein
MYINRISCLKGLAELGQGAQGTLASGQSLHTIACRKMNSIAERYESENMTVIPVEVQAICRQLLGCHYKDQR